MATRDKIVSLPFNRSLDTKTNYIINELPSELDNVRMDKDGVYRKRFGHDTLSLVYNNTDGPAIPTSGVYAFAHKKDLLVNDSGYFFKYDPLTSSFDEMKYKPLFYPAVDVITKSKYSNSFFNSVVYTDNIIFTLTQGRISPKLQNSYTGMELSIYNRDGALSSTEQREIEVTTPASSPFDPNFDKVCAKAGLGGIVTTNLELIDSLLPTERTEISIEVRDSLGAIVNSFVVSMESGESYQFHCTDTLGAITYLDNVNGDLTISTFDATGILNTVVVDVAANLTADYPHNLRITDNFIWVYYAYLSAPDIYGATFKYDHSLNIVDPKSTALVTNSAAQTGKATTIAMGASDTDLLAYVNFVFPPTGENAITNLMLVNGYTYWLNAVVTTTPDAQALRNIYLMRGKLTSSDDVVIAKLAEYQIVTGLVGNTTFVMPELQYVDGDIICPSIDDQSLVVARLSQREYYKVSDAINFMGNSIVFGANPAVYDGNELSSTILDIIPQVGFVAFDTSTTPLPTEDCYYVATFYYIDNTGNIYETYASDAIYVDAPVRKYTELSVFTPNARYSGLDEIVGISTSNKNAYKVRLYKAEPVVVDGIPTEPPFSEYRLVEEKFADAGTSTPFYDDTSLVQISSNEGLYLAGGILPMRPIPPNLGGCFFNGRVVVIDAVKRNTLAYSQYYQPGTGISFPQEYRLYIEDNQTRESENLTAVQAMDSKLFIFKPSSILVIYGEGPDATGSNGDFTEPEIVSSDLGCSEPRSTVLTSQGIFFKGKKGIWLLGRNMEVSYVGAGVEQYNDEIITGSINLPEFNEVRFTTLTGRTLCFNYLFKKWTTFSNYEAICSNLWDGKYFHLKADGKLEVEHSGFRDNGDFVKRVIDSGWLKAASVTGYQRLKKFQLIGEYVDDHQIKVTSYHDYEKYGFTEWYLQPLSSGYNRTDKPDIQLIYGGENNGVYQYDVSVVRQKGQAIRFVFEDVDTGTTQEGFKLSSLDIRLGMKQGLYKNVDNKQF